MIASNFGQSRHPGWYHNVEANPRVTLEARGHRGPFVGAEITGAGRDRLFALAKQFIPDYADYEKRCGDRLIPVLAFTEADR